MTQMHPHVKIKWDETSSEADWHEPAALYMYEGGHTGDVAMPPQPSCGFTYNMENARKWRSVSSPASYSSQHMSTANVCNSPSSKCAYQQLFGSYPW